MVVLWGSELVQIYSDGYRAIMGAKHPAGLGQPTRQCWPEVWQFNAPVYEAVLGRAESLTFEHQRLVIERHGSPEEAFFTLTYSPVFNEAGQAAGVLVTVLETTGEVAQTLAEERLHVALQAADLGTWDLDLTTDKAAVRSLRHDQIFGYEQAQPDWGQQIAMRHVLEEDRPLFQQAFARAGQTGVLSLEVRVRWPDGTVHWIEALGRTYYDGEGRPVRMAGVVADITERSRIEALRESEYRYRSLFESIDQSFCVVEVLMDNAGQPFDYRFLETNPAFIRDTGLIGVVGETARELVPQLGNDWTERYGRIALTGEPERFLHRENVTDRWFEVEAFRVGKPEAHRVAVLSKEITERKRDEDTLRDNERRKNEFLATLAHELRNPMAPLKTGLVLLKLSGKDPSRLLKTVSMMDRQLSHLGRLVDDLLDVGRISSGKLRVDKRLIGLQDVLSRSLESTQPLFEARQHELSLHIPLEDLVVDGDPDRLEQVFSNLLSNAAKYTGRQGRIRLSVEPEDDHLQVIVVDNGIGIPAEDLGQVFDLFSQVRTHQDHWEGGLGIGLALARELVSLHGGTLTANSAGSGLGSTFSVRLPRAVASLATSPGGDEISTADPVASRLRVLVADDNQDAADTLAAVLRMLGHEVITASDGREAVQAVMTHQPEVVILDLGMPNVDGFEAARQIRALPGVRLKRLIAVTGWGQPLDVQRTEAAGFDAHLLKPVAIEELSTHMF